VKVGFKFQSLGKISNISAADHPSSFRSIPTLTNLIDAKQQNYLRSCRRKPSNECWCIQLQIFCIQRHKTFIKARNL